MCRLATVRHKPEHTIKATPKREAAVSVRQSRTMATHMTRRILLADDHKSARQAIADFIQSSGEDWLVCSDAETGAAAVTQALETKPDLAILDIAMPDMDGITAAREIRKRDPRIPILIHSLYATPELDSVARQQGFQGAVAKADSAGLIAAIREVFGSADSAGGAPKPAAPSPASENHSAQQVLD
jgi:DNA-binding NarL/FixJ family response regulator